jgi:hypothetical protein
MRIDQFRGLNNWARRKVRRTTLVHEVGKEIRPSGKEVPFDRVRRVACAEKVAYSKVRGRYKPFVGDLHRYTLASGVVLEEFLQATMNSGGPVYHIALRDARTGVAVPQSLWTDEELAHA